MTSWDGAAFRADLQAVLEEFLDEMADRLAPLGPDADRLLAEARTCVSGGKRFRAAFCYWGFRAHSPVVADERALLRACAALELLHSSALVHDDFMDASDTRRGRPATHRGFAAEHRDAGWRGDPEQYGAAGAILLGDLLLGWADELVRRCGLPWDRVGPALDVFDLCRSEVIAGQFLDVSAQARGQADVDTAMTVLRYKSAKYSIERPLHIGAALAGGPAETLADLAAYGLPLGEAFRDTVLDGFAPLAPVLELGANLPHFEPQATDAGQQPSVRSRTRGDRGRAAVRLEVAHLTLQQRRLRLRRPDRCAGVASKGAG